MRHGLGLGGIIVIGGLLYYAGAGTKLMQGLGQLEGGCYDALGQVMHGAATPVCGMVGNAVRFTDKVTSNMGTYVREGKDRLLAQLSGTRVGSQAESIQSFSQQMWHSATPANIPALQSLGSSASALADKIRRGPQSLASGASASEQVRTALDDYTIGQKYWNGGNGSADQALPWLQQGAALPGYGVMSQMSLGDIYSHGSGGVAADPGMAATYYNQAVQSISALQASNTTEAQQLLQSLQGTPQQVKQQLQAAITQLKAKH